jgi:transcriptional regulator with XRE-family HTH domain
MIVPDSGHFGALLRGLRRRSALTQQSLAERAGLSVQAIAALESGLRNAPYAHTVTSIADALSLAGNERGALEACAGRARLRRSLHAEATRTSFARTSRSRSTRSSAENATRRGSRKCWTNADWSPSSASAESARRG